MKTPKQKKFFFLVALFLLLLTACSPKTEDPANTSQETSGQTLMEITYCNVDPSNLCLEGFGQKGEDQLIVLFKSNGTDYNDIYIGIEKNKNETLFECVHAEDFQTNIYCTGDFFPNGEEVQINIYSINGIIAKGNFSIQHGVIELPENVEESASVPTPSPDYQNPSYPNYPNPSYENPTETP